MLKLNFRYVLDDMNGLVIFKPRIKPGSGLLKLRMDMRTTRLQSGNLGALRVTEKLNAEVKF